jgi:hypothetical protein
MALHARACGAAALARVVLVQHVQVRIHRVTHCGKIAGMWTTPDGADLWVVDLVDGGRAHVAPRNTVQCSGIDGRCFCADEVPA